MRDVKLLAASLDTLANEWSRDTSRNATATSKFVGGCVACGDREQIAILDLSEALRGIFDSPH